MTPKKMWRKVVVDDHFMDFVIAEEIHDKIVLVRHVACVSIVGTLVDTDIVSPKAMRELASRLVECAEYFEEKKAKVSKRKAG